MVKRIERKHLVWRTRRLSDGTVIEYPTHLVTWWEGGKQKRRQITLKWGNDPAELDRLYWLAETGTHPQQVRGDIARRTWGDLVKLWQADPREQKRLSAGTLRSYQREMGYILAKNADKPVAALTRADLRAVHSALSETPRKADWRVQMVSKLWNYAKRKKDWPLGDNPAEGLDLFGVSSPFNPWPQWMVDALDDAPADVRTLARLILGRGERPGAAVLARWDAFSGDWMTVTDEKMDHTYEVYCPAGLASYLDGVPRRGAYILPKNLTEPRGYSAVEKEFRTWRAKLGPKAKGYVLHGLRKLAIVQLAESGATDAEIQAITNQTPETIAYYRTMADRKVMSRNAQIRRERGLDRT
ncbi:hypothetical protein [Mangrovicoccus ximenensis]|uniref:hypothetical protein n=1 Tax=Mangrovicoccus ximenensis TaxID=1911570 RepID=UPI000D35C67C|nr:hypothetical protein [Mangrovicoccus ximenensis]